MLTFGQTRSNFFCELGPFESLLESFFGFFFLAKNYSNHFRDFPNNFCFTFYSFVSLFSSQGPGGGFPPVVGSNGLEPSTSRLSGVRSNHLSYEPISVAGRFHRPNLLLRLGSGYPIPRLPTSSFNEPNPRIGSGTMPLVETNRIELSTPCLQGRCSPS